MPSFYVDEIDVSVDEVLSSCTEKEKLELIEGLVDGGYIDKSALPENNIKANKFSASEKIFEEHLNALHGRCYQLTKQEEETIMAIAKRFIHL